MNLYESPYEPEPARTRASKEFSRVGFSLLTLNIVLLIVAYAMQFALIFAYEGNYDALVADWWWNWVLSLVPLYAVATPVMLLVLHGLPKAPHNDTYVKNGETLEKSPFTVGKFFLLLVIALGCMYIGSYIGQTVMAVLSMIANHDYESSLNSMVTESPVWMTFIGTVICAPIGEEFLFRKLLIDRTRRWGDLISILVSALTFALFHGNLFQFFYAFFIGAILAYIYTRTGKLRWCMAMHAAVNFFGSILIPWLTSFIPTELLEGTTSLENTTEIVGMLDYLKENALGLFISLALTALVNALMVAAVVLIAVFARRVQLSRGAYRLNVSESLSAALLNPGMIASLAVMCLTILSNLITPLLTVG